MQVEAVAVGTPLHGAEPRPKLTLWGQSTVRVVLVSWAPLSLPVPGASSHQEDLITGKSAEIQLHRGEHWLGLPTLREDPVLQQNAWVTLGNKAPLQASVSCSANEKWGQSSSSPSPFDILWLIILIDTLSLLPTAQLALLGGDRWVPDMGWGTLASV